MRILARIGSGRSGQAATTSARSGGVGRFVVDQMWSNRPGHLTGILALPRFTRRLGRS